MNTKMAISEKASIHYQGELKPGSNDNDYNGLSFRNFLSSHSLKSRPQPAHIHKKNG